MKYCRLLVFVIFGAVLACYAEGPELSFAHREVDLGYFDADSVQTATFDIYNSGTDSLVIYRVHTECRCTHPHLGKKILAPGDSTILTVKYNGEGRKPGRLRQPIRLRTNAADPYSSCYVTGEIKRRTQR